MSAGAARVNGGKSMFDAGAKFQPVSRAELGFGSPLRLSGGVFVRQPHLGSVPTAPSPRHAGELAQSTMRPSAQPGAPVPSGQAQRVGPFAWGRLKKLEAKELSDQLALLTERMRRVGVPYGILEKIKDELASFAKTSDLNAEIEITAEEAHQIEEAVLQLEAAEREAEGAGVSPALVVAGLGLGALLLFSL